MVRGSDLGSINRYLLSKTFRPAVGPILSPIKWVPGLFLGVGRPGREVNHSPLSSVDVTYEWSHTCTPSCVPSDVDSEDFEFDRYS